MPGESQKAQIGGEAARRDSMLQDPQKGLVGYYWGQEGRDRDLMRLLPGWVHFFVKKLGLMGGGRLSLP